jgi:hypothetical protein
MTYELKDKINTTPELLSDFEMKGWQEIEHLQAQIANLAEGAANDKLRQLLNNLLTSYYVFTGGIEALESVPMQNQPEINQEPIADEEVAPDIIDDIPIEISDEVITDSIITAEDDFSVSEPFEYFVDFDDPTGEALTDEDLYG